MKRIRKGCGLEREADKKKCKKKCEGNDEAIGMADRRKTKKCMTTFDAI